ncbi:MAG: glycosyltransferase family 87 protein [Acidobacteriota bacterium]|nr:glycosyltransferase family 87 protein [Acidobacteriota bacterium]
MRAAIRALAARAQAQLRNREGLFASRTATVTLAALSLFLLAVPLTIGKPGQPATLKADESAYYLMALSLARDFDLSYEPADGDRLLEEFPFSSTGNLILMTSDDWRTVHYGKPLAYPLFGAPFAALWGANGLLFLNMALFVAMLWLAAVFLARRASPAVAATFACGLLLLSACSRYVFWLQPEVFNMFGVFGALYWGFENRPRAWWLTILSGVLLALPAYNKPMFAAIALPLAGAFLLRRQWRTAALWIAGFAATLALLSAMSLGWTGQLLPYLGSDVRAAVRVCEPGGWPPEIIEARRIAAGAAPTTGEAAAAVTIPDSPTGNTFSWLFRVPRQSFGEVIENVGYFLVGRHAGLLPYHPFAVIAFGLFLFSGRRDRDRWLLVLALAVIAGYFLLFIGWNWQGGGGFIGNRYFVSVMPAFLFLVPGRIPPWTLPAGFLAAGLFVGAMVLAPFGVTVPAPTLQAHTRNAPLRYLPFEFSLRNVPGYERRSIAGMTILGRADRVLERGGSWWVAARGPSELFIESRHRFDSLTLFVTSPVAPNHVRLRLDGGPAVDVEFAEAGRRQRVTLASSRPHKTRRRDGHRSYVHRLRVETDRGAPTIWTRVRPPAPCAVYAWNRESDETFYLGAELRFLGSEEHMNAEVFAARIGTVGLMPATLPAGAEVELPVGVTNESQVTWRRQGYVGVNLASRWRQGTAGPEDDGSERGPQVGPEGRRSLLPELGPGGFETVMLPVRAPDEPGDYTLEIDLVYEHVAWFEQRGGVPLRLPVRVEAPGTPE